MDPSNISEKHTYEWRDKWTLESMNQSNGPFPSDMDILDKMNNDKARLFIPVLLYTVILLVIGVLGNPLAIYIYGWRWELTTTRNFLLCLSIIDFINCLTTIPIEIVIILKSYFFDSGHLCKMSRFTTYVMNNTTPMILVFIAVDRYIRICRKRTKRIAPRTAFYACGIAVVVGILVSWPSLILYGRREITIPLPGRNITGVMCLVESQFKGTVYPFIFFVYLWVGVTVIGCLIVILYTFIDKEVYRRKRLKKAKMKLVEETLKRLQAKRRSMSNTSALTSGTERTGEDICPIGIKCAPNMKPGRSTLMLFAIAVVYLLSFLPFLIVITVRTICGENFYKNLSKTEEVIVNIFIRSYLFNNCFNPVVYGMCNVQFRREVKYIYYRIFKRTDDMAMPRTASVSNNPNW